MEHYLEQRLLHSCIAVDQRKIWTSYETEVVAWTGMKQYRHMSQDWAWLGCGALGEAQATEHVQKKPVQMVLYTLREMGCRALVEMQAT